MPLSVIAESYLLNPKTFEKQYKDVLSGFKTWDQLSHAEDYILFPCNLGPYLSIDEVNLSNGELYTVVTNKQTKGKAGSLVAIIKGTKNSVVSEVLSKIPYSERLKVEEVTLDMSNTMDWIVRCNFPEATKILDRFHVQQLVFDAMQDVRISLRWKAIEEENEEMKEARKQNMKYRASTYGNGDTKKQLLARSRYLLFKPEIDWTDSQKLRASILFREFPEMKEAYDLAMNFRFFYEEKDLNQAKKKLEKWYSDVEKNKSKFTSFVTAKNSVKSHQEEIMNYFKNRQTNAGAESFNAKIKSFRGLVRGVTDKKFFLFRISKIYG